MKEAYLESPLRRVASSARDSLAGSKRYFCPVVDEQTGLQPLLYVNETVGSDGCSRRDFCWHSQLSG